jgi:hexosaminidase
MDPQQTAPQLIAAQHTTPRHAAVVPRPAEVVVGAGETVLSPGFPVATSLAAQELGREGYRLTVDADGVRIEAADEAGIFYGRQTLRQLLPPSSFRRAPIADEPWRVPHVRITDRPRFRWRGTLLDVARHFLPKADVLRFIDLMALHKLNVLHFHLTEDQGWRLEIKRYPRLTEVGAWRAESPIGNPDAAEPRYDGRPHGGYYTQDDIREIVAYAAERHITVVPEIDVPGHSMAAIAAYPELGNQDVPSAERPREVWTRWGVTEAVLNVEEATIEFYQNVLDEVCELFPSEYVCIGGDECPKAEWQGSSRAQQRMAELGLADEDGLQAWFLNRLGDHLAKKGRKLLGWDEILEGELSPGTVVASWRGTEGAVEAAGRGHDTVNCPVGWVYLDFKQSDDPAEPIPVSITTSLEKVYSFEPVPADLDPDLAHHVIGAQANLWTEYMDSPRTVDYMAFPRLCAFAETVWSSDERDFAEFGERLATHLERLDAIGVEYRRADGPLPWQRRPGVPGR